ncbi:MAG TPA: CDF family Co(II)/Ni(II) efflux transporter DmeF [Caulobacteraceae bacterium]
MRPDIAIPNSSAALLRHGHAFLGAGHESNERRTWIVIGLCGLMMVAEIAGGLAFGSLALVADGLHMSTHAGALLLAALAYTFARRYADDARFTFGTGKLGDLAGFTSAIVLVMIALLISYEAVLRFLSPVPIHFAQAIPIAVVGLGVNLASAWLLGASDHDHHHGHGHAHGHGQADGDHGHDYDETRDLITEDGASLRLEIFETDVPPKFRLRGEDGRPLHADDIRIETTRSDGRHQVFTLDDRGGYLESRDEIPEPHAFTARVIVGQGADARSYEAVFDEGDHDHGAHHRDNNMRAAVVHVMADAAVSVLVIAGLVLAKAFGWLWMDPLAGLVGALVIASWSYGLIRDTGAILLDMNPDRRLAGQLRQVVEGCGDAVADLHLWRLGPGHLGAIVCVATEGIRDSAFYRARLERFPTLSHLTVEVTRIAA